MLFNYLVISFRDLQRRRMYCVIGIAGLAIGLCAAMLAGVVIRNQLSYDRFIAGYEDVYMVVSELTPKGRTSDYNVRTHARAADYIRSRFPQVGSVARLADQSVRLRRGEVESKETIYWADPGVFEVLRFPVVAGDLATALRKPDSIVISRALARKYFGRDAPVGETLQLDDAHFMEVAAVIEDFPANGTQFGSGVFASGRAAWSALSLTDADAGNAIGGAGFSISVRTYLRLSTGTSPARVQEAMPGLMNDLWPRRPPGLAASMSLTRLDKVHLFEGLNPGVRGRVTATGIIGLLILFIAVINFVNLSTARSGLRAMEVGLRKACGASRVSLALQFLNESLVHVGIATLLAIALTQWLLPHLNAFLGVGAVFDYWRDPMLALSILVGAVLVAIGAGIYPALVLSSFRPVRVLNGRAAAQWSANTAREVLVSSQFAILVVMMIAAGVIYQQRVHATRDALRVDTDQMLAIEAPCSATLKAELQALTGVRGTACASWALLRGEQFANILWRAEPLAIDVVPVEFSVLDLYGVVRVAGDIRSFAGKQDASSGDSRQVVINETGARRLGFLSAQAAIGEVMTLPPDSADGSPKSVEIAGVVQDFSLTSVEHEIKPTIYYASRSQLDLVNVKLTAEQVPEALAAIEQTWGDMGNAEPIRYFFVDDYIQNLYLSTLREVQALGVFAGVAVMLACMGMFGLALATTGRRTREIAIRKALGAKTSDVMRLLLWQFARPVLLANLIAWPVGVVVMDHWLRGFAYHIDLDPWLFIGAAALALAIALLTVSANCYRVARLKPAMVLRFE